MAVLTFDPSLTGASQKLGSTNTSSSFIIGTSPVS